jgi:Domain of unknown function (DUF5667)
VSRRRRKERSDRLDAALDGRLVEVDDDLAPLVETAARLRAALAGVELDPEAAERHLGMVLESEAEVGAVSTRPRPPASRWRRQVAAVALAAALTVVPATMASASALPGQALYPVKLAVEQLQLTVVSWSSTREADERIRIANNRLDELNRLIQLNAADRIPPAIVRLHQSYIDARQAVKEAVRDTGNVSQARALDAKLAPVGAELERLQDQGMLLTSAQQVLPAASGQPPVTLSLGTGTPQPTPTIPGSVATTLAGSATTIEAPTTTQAVTTSTEAATTTTQVPTTTTEAATTTTQVPTTTTVAPDVSNSPDPSGDDSGQGNSGETAPTLP